MSKRLIINEEEKNRILNLHKSAIKKEVLFEQTTQTTTVAPTTTQTTTVAPTTTQTTTVAPTSKPNNEVLLQGTDTDYDYKKVGDKYYFKLKENPTSVGAKGYKTQGKFKDWTPATNQEAIKKISQLPALSTAAAFQAPTNVDGSDETFDAPVQTAGTTTPTTTTPTPTTPTATTPTTPTSQNTEIAADLKTASQIRQEFRQGKQDKNKAIRQYNQMVSKYNRLKSKMSPQDNAAYLQAMNQLKQQMG
jgi:hypothetical protein